MRMHNLGTVIAFEVRRTLSKPTFWAASLSVPLLMAVVFALSYAGSAAAESSQTERNAGPVTFTWTDASGIVDAGVATRLGGTEAPDADAAARAVREGRADLHVDVPADPAREPVLVTGRDLGLTESGRWAAVAYALVTESAAARVGDPRIVATLDGVDIRSDLYLDGRLSPGPAAAIAPGAFLVLLFMTIVMLGQQMLNITVEEKENRVTEMILTTIHPGTLILGKVIGVVIAGVVQGAVLLVPLLGAAWVAGSGAFGDVRLPENALPPGMESMASLAIDPVRVVIAAALFTGSFLLFAGLLVAIGAVMPTAKDAGSAFGAVILGMFVPIYAAGLVVSDPTSPLSQALTYFPLTAPATALLRNALGSLSLLEAAIVLVILFTSAAAVLWLGARLFREGSIAYDRRLDLRKVLRRAR